MAQISPKQQKVLNFIQATILEKGYAPSYQEIAAAQGINTVSTIHKHITALTRAGLIKKSPNAKRNLTLTQLAETDAVAIPLLGTIAAGSPIENFSEPELLDLPAALRPRHTSYALKVRGNSMIGEGICDGDTVIIEDRRTASNGEIVVALIEGREATLKKFRRLEGGSEIELSPANPDMKPRIYPAAQIAIQGVLSGLIRKY
jgi:repressor LexA